MVRRARVKPRRPVSNTIWVSTLGLQRAPVAFLYRLRRIHPKLQLSFSLLPLTHRPLFPSLSCPPYTFLSFLSAFAFHPCQTSGPVGPSLRHLPALEPQGNLDRSIFARSQCRPRLQRRRRRRSCAAIQLHPAPLDLLSPISPIGHAVWRSDRPTPPSPLRRISIHTPKPPPMIVVLLPTTLRSTASPVGTSRLPMLPGCRLAVIPPQSARRNAHPPQPGPNPPENTKEIPQHSLISERGVTWWELPHRTALPTRRSMRPGHMGPRPPPHSPGAVQQSRRRQANGPLGRLLVRVAWVK